MSVTAAQASSTLSAALADEVTRLGGVGAAAAECGISEDSIRRRCNGTHDWSAGDIARMMATKLSQLRSSLVLDRLNALAAGARPIGDQRRTTTDARAALPSLLRVASDLADAVHDGTVDRTEARKLLADIDGSEMTLAQLRADLMALLGG